MIWKVNEALVRVRKKDNQTKRIKAANTKRCFHFQINDFLMRSLRLTMFVLCLCVPGYSQINLRSAFTATDLPKEATDGVGCFCSTVLHPVSTEAI